MSNPLDDLLNPKDRSATGRYGTPTKLLDNLEITESGGNNPKAINKDSGATGSYQFMPSTVKMLQSKGIKFDPTDQTQSRDAADQYIQSLVKSNGGDYAKAMATYGGFVKQDPIAYQKKVLAGVELPNPLDSALGPVSTAGGGRGGQGGATAAQNAQRIPSPSVATSPSNVRGETGQSKELSDVGSAIGTFAKNVGKGVTLGATDYAAAAVDKIVNGGSYEDALKNIREINKADDTKNPGSALAGQLTGDVIGGVATGSAGVRAAGAVGEAANLGKVGQFFADLGAQVGLGATTSGSREALTNENATASSIAKAAAVGGTLAGVGSATASAAGGVASIAERKLAQSTFPELSPAEALKNLRTTNLAARGGDLGGTVPLGEVVAGTAKSALKAAGAIALPAAGAVAVGYVGGKLAPMVGLSEQTGETLGAELGGGGAGYKVLKKQWIQKAAGETADMIGYAKSAYPRLTEAGVNTLGQTTANLGSTYATPPEPKSLTMQTIEQYDADRAASKAQSQPVEQTPTEAAPVEVNPLDELLGTQPNRINTAGVRG